ncbi:MAG: glycosyltransferase family 39 protein [bacterium]
MKDIEYPCIVVLLLFIAFSLGYSMIVPVFNAPDEPFHFEYMRFLAQNRQLPNQATEERAISTEGFNPPLYYALNAPFLHVLSPNQGSDIHIHGYDDIVNFYRYPHRGFGEKIYPPLNPGYVKWGRGRDLNMFLTTKEDTFPFSGGIRLVHLLRILSMVFGALTILFIFTTARTLFTGNKRLALLAMAIAAFNPQFNFLSGSLNNDNLVILLATISLWLVARLIRKDYRKQNRLAILLGIAVGLGFITKVNIAAVALVALAGIIVASLVDNAQKLRALFTNLGLFLVMVAGIAGWYFVRNIMIYGWTDPFGWNLLASQNPGLVLPAHMRTMFFKRIFFPRLFTSFWGLFDWLTVPLPGWAYWIYGLISLTGIAGLIRVCTSKRHDGRAKICMLLFLAAILITVGSLVTINFTFASAQARLIFPVLAGFCIFMALGVHWVLTYPARLLSMKTQLWTYAFILFLILLDLYTLLRVVYPVYR